MRLYTHHIVREDQDTHAEIQNKYAYYGVQTYGGKMVHQWVWCPANRGRLFSLLPPSRPTIFTGQNRMSVKYLGAHLQGEHEPTPSPGFAATPVHRSGSEGSPEVHFVGASRMLSLSRYPTWSEPPQTQGAEWTGRWFESGSIWRTVPRKPVWN